MKSTVYICDGCGKHAEGYPHDWYEVKRSGLVLPRIEAHLCSDECALTWASRLAGNAHDVFQPGREIAPGVHVCSDDCEKCAGKLRERLERAANAEKAGGAV